MQRRNAQDYTAEEFDAVVAMIRGDADLRADIEAITGQALEGMSPRELFNTFRAIQRAADVQKALPVLANPSRLLSARHTRPRHADVRRRDVPVRQALPGHRCPHATSRSAPGPARPAMSYALRSMSTPSDSPPHLMPSPAGLPPRPVRVVGGQGRGGW